MHLLDQDDSEIKMSDCESQKSCDEGDLELQAFKDIIQNNVDIYCNTKYCDYHKFVAFLSLNIVDIIKYIVQGIELASEITNDPYFNLTYQYIYDVYMEVFGDCEDVDQVLTEEALIMLRISY